MPHGTAKNSSRNRISLKYQFFSVGKKNTGFCLKRIFTKDMFSVDNNDGVVKNWNAFSAKNDGFGPKCASGLHRGWHELWMYNYESFPLQAEIPRTDSFLHLQGWHHTTKNPRGSLERAWGIKCPAEWCLGDKAELSWIKTYWIFTFPLKVTEKH